jgi:cyclopropane fatty-acyl-phospholipid synthase-like methyltransferase
MALAEATRARITATDASRIARDTLRARITAGGFSDRIEVRNVDMAALPAPERPLDMIVSEGSAHIPCVEKALAGWRARLRPGGALVCSDMVWRTSERDDEMRRFRAAEHPATATPATRVAQARRADYRVTGHFEMGPEGMEAHY